ncbi:MAG: type II toxin-antitoxin system HicA family toxin [Magnetococcales bacterium]|nr:type II toxin-antitoxin system HicA family toxin [Magnetococcales bacterium]MBF0420683.1 type II toxin-antitoxin system HicA family toxin [Magnetococcales bacterium]
MVPDTVSSKHDDSDKVIRKMRNNPRDWRIEDIQAIAHRYGVTIRNPRGSHVIVSHPNVTEVLSIPAHKPVKPI